MDDRADDLTFVEPPGDFLTAPVNRVIAHMDDAAAVAAAIEDLSQAGFDRDEVFVLCGPKGAERLDASGRRHGLRGRVYRLMEVVMTDAHEALMETERHLNAGGLVISVPADDDTHMDTASRILREQGGHYIHHFSKSTFRRLGA